MSNIVKISKIDDFGGPSENPRNIVLGGPFREVRVYNSPDFGNFTGVMGVREGAEIDGLLLREVV